MTQAEPIGCTSPEEADRMIDAGATVRDIRPMFATRRLAVEYFAARQGARHAESKVTPQCSLCGGCREIVTLRCRWAALFTRLERLWWAYFILHAVATFAGKLPKDGGHGVIVESVIYDTFHGACRLCHGRIERRRKWGRALTYLGAFSVMVGVPGLLMLILLVTDVVSREYYDQALAVSPVGLVGLILAPVALWWGRRLQRPPFADAVSRRPFSRVPDEMVIAAVWREGSGT
jgi:hypothetical protein